MLQLPAATFVCIQCEKSAPYPAILNHYKLEWDRHKGCMLSGPRGSGKWPGNEEAKPWYEWLLLPEKSALWRQRELLECLSRD